jgi:hypothetical protein
MDCGAQFFGRRAAMSRKKGLDLFIRHWRGLYATAVGTFEDGACDHGVLDGYCIRTHLHGSGKVHLACGVIGVDIRGLEGSFAGHRAAAYPVGDDTIGLFLDVCDLALVIAALRHWTAVLIDRGLSEANLRGVRASAEGRI